MFTRFLLVTAAVSGLAAVPAALEDRVKEKFQQIYRVTIHPEPVEEK